MHACMSLFAFFSQRNSGTGTDGRESEAKGASVYLAFPNHQSPHWNSITVVICNSAGVSSRYIHREPSAGFQEVGQCLGVGSLWGQYTQLPCVPKWWQLPHIMCLCLCSPRILPSLFRSYRTSREQWSCCLHAKAQPGTLMRPQSADTSSGTHSQYPNWVSSYACFHNPAWRDLDAVLCHTLKINTKDSICLLEV